MKVLHVISSVHPTYGGPTQALHEILKMLSSGETQCSLAVGAAHPDEGPMLETLRKHATVYSFQRMKPDFFGLTFGFTFAIDKLIRNADIVHVHSMWNWSVCFAAWRAVALGKPVVVRPASALDKFDVQKKGLAKKILGPLFLKKILSSPNYIQCTSRREAVNIEMYGGNAKKVVLPLPVASASMALDRQAARLKLGIPADAEVVLFMSRIDYKKGLELLIPALDSVLAVNSNVFLLLAGAGGVLMSERLDILLAGSNIRYRSIKLGFVSGEFKRAALCASDVFVLPSMNENFGVSVVEALLAGLPVVISKNVYISDDIGYSDAVRVCERTIDSVAQAIESQLNALREHHHAIRASALSLASKHYSPDVLKLEYEAFYKKIGGLEVVL